MTTKLSEAEAFMLVRDVRRVEAARRELSKPSGRHLAALLLVLFPFVLVLASGEHLTTLYKISPQLLNFLMFLISILVGALVQIASLQCKVNALVELARLRNDGGA